MEKSALQRVLNFLSERLQVRGDNRPIGSEDSLFGSGRLDSLDAIQTVLFLEKNFGVDFANLDFSIELIDSAASITALINQHWNPAQLRG